MSVQGFFATAGRLMEATKTPPHAEARCVLGKVYLEWGDALGVVKEPEQAEDPRALVLIGSAHGTSIEHSRPVLSAQ